ncbi:hypothetical protein K438DRAFT_1759574 [Mycena galopus ATCC 62051]|nr:hypothetical protein K438DRAFT_1759574 [Mycena galopus ATCC 62051]
MWVQVWRDEEPRSQTLRREWEQNRCSLDGKGSVASELGLKEACIAGWLGSSVNVLELSMTEYPRRCVHNLKCVGAESQRALRVDGRNVEQALDFGAASMDPRSKGSWLCGRAVTRVGEDGALAGTKTKTVPSDGSWRSMGLALWGYVCGEDSSSFDIDALWKSLNYLNH